MKAHSRFRVAKNFLIFWCLFIGIGAVAGATGMLVAPDGSAMGMQAILPYFKVLPFAEYLFCDFVFPGISLLIVNGLTNLTAAALMFARKKCGIVMGMIFGFTLMAWICIQFVILPMNFLSTIYFIFGIIQTATGYAALVFSAQENFARTAEKCDNRIVGVKTLVVYFSRMGYTRKIALETAEKLGADIYEVRSAERTSGTLGFWWCGRYGMHTFDMPIVPVSVDVSSYDKVVICSPIWVFALSAPIRSFCREECGNVKSVEYKLVHYQKCDYKNAADEMDKLLGVESKNTESICFRKGKVISRKTI